MKNLRVHIEISPALYIKNPESSDLGRKIISRSIEMIYEMGIESFTFKKLGQSINSPESSIYRYFENKHLLLIYLTSWYWTWTEYRIVFAIANVTSKKERLKSTIEILTQPALEDSSISFVNEVLLSEIIFSESLKGYHTKKVDEENTKGYFKAYKNVVQRVRDLILEADPTYKYPRMLVTTIIEGAHQQKYFAEHLPSLTNVNDGNPIISRFYTELVFNSLNISE